VAKRGLQKRFVKQGGIIVEGRGVVKRLLPKEIWETGWQKVSGRGVVKGGWQKWCQIEGGN
jgi:hypothetical protein